MTTTEPRRFHLTRNYSLASLGMIVIVSILMSYAYHRNAECAARRVCRAKKTPKHGLRAESTP